MFKFTLYFVYLIFSLVNFNSLNSLELKLICESYKDKPANNDFRDLIVSLNSNEKTVTLGGFKFKADNFSISESNIKWSASKLQNMYDSTSGFTEGVLGRFSGDLSLLFRKDGSISKNNLNLNCKKLKMKERKF